ncbi:MAG TPA: alginate lyase family protein, partial [Terriglobia bacterium]|nr:alginate lyase family protein [Terriglobia bacterium]
MKRVLRKLRTASFNELFVRGSQLLSAFAERQAWSNPPRLISDSELLERIDVTQLRKTGSRSAPSVLDLRDHFRERRSPHFFPSFDNPASTVAQFQQRWPGLQEKIVERAERIAKGRFDFLGLRDLSFGDPVNWHLEPLAGKSSPLVHWSRLDYLNADLFGDKKIVWELNRHQYFAVLGQAYGLTGDERYAETFAAHVDSWMAQNPPKLGINWASSLEVAFRSISWLWALYFFKNSGVLTPELFARICKFLYVSARHLETYPSTYFSPNTHLTGEALGLFYLGTVLPEFKESPQWRDNALRILLKELISRQVLPDGVYFEQSTYYHRYTTDFYLHLSILLRVNQRRDLPEIDEKLGLLLDHLLFITRPDGTTPLVGDDDGGRFLPLDDRPANDFRSTLATGGALFERSDYKFVSGGASPETLWLLGSSGLEALDRISDREPLQESIAFAAGGYYVMRDGWKPDSNYLLFDCGPHGTDNCGHAHADSLSLALSVKGRTLLVDPGTYTYTGSREMRDWFRSSAAHNTLSVDGESSSVPAGPFSWTTIAHG